MLKEFFIRKMIQSKLGNLPKEQVDKIVTAISKNPQFFQEIATEIQAEVKKGKKEQEAAIGVMMKHQDKLKELFNAEG